MQNVHRYFLLSRAGLPRDPGHDVWKALWFTDPATGATQFGIGVGTLVLAVNVCCSAATRSAATRCGTSSAGARPALASHRQHDGYNCVEVPQPRAHALGVGEPVLGRLSDLYVRLCSMGVWTDWRIL
jgi:hypothetical protein